MLVNSLNLGYDAEEIRSKLVARVVSVVASGDAELSVTAAVDLVNKCIDLFLQYMFPSTPIAHERTLRAGASLFLSEHSLRAPESMRPRDGQDQTSFAKNFTLITALCAFVMSVMPNSLLPIGKELAGPFYQASKAMFRLYEEHDLQHPDSTSLTIRIWYSSAIQNMTGKAGAAWHYHTEASVLALRLRLYDEQAICRPSAVESRLLRANFWLLYQSDKAAVALENRPSILGEHLFEDDLTLLEQGDQHEPLLDETKKLAQGALEQRIVFGFHLKARIWTAAGKLVADIKSYSRWRKQLGSDNTRKDVDAAYRAMIEANLCFSTLTSNLEPWLQDPDSIEAVDPRVAAYQKTSFWCLRSNIMTTYHCLRLVILQKCIDHDLLEIVGLSTQPLSWAIKKVDIVQDFLYELRTVPFLCYKVQGEAGVERIRRVGSLLLELAQNVENEVIRDRARSQFEQLLDFLARLDSKASDDLDNRHLVSVP
ncbi:uncharacterized protein AB675_8591 [Cyphellophora attinorum]|uniref:Transcription factor domain-containing protein n=1 Tax=Cyphellophora attinorum TaxID=1664694 RepID=A0A0N0NR40_9EURO|nr:uncharacterized protein AB675_8591 [Phialophora attinorum]KPI44389.1 hypothetical protein AB675_8591 [Phialophora attinorum]